MESIFTESSEKSIQEESLLISYETRSARDPDHMIASGNSSGKQELDEEEEEYPSEPKPNDQSEGKTHKKPLTGLDLLIRNTSGENPNNPSSQQRKISFVFDKDLLSKLKAIAQKEKTYFREMVTDVLRRFVDKYEKDNGKID